MYSISYSNMATKSGTQAGFEFAEKVGITSQAEVDAYDGPSESFRKGMQAWVDQIKKKRENDNETATETNQ
jgi:hypothetical protein